MAAQRNQPRRNWANPCNPWHGGTVFLGLEPHRMPGKQVHQPGQRQSDSDKAGCVLEDRGPRPLGSPGRMQQPQHQGDAAAHDQEMEDMTGEKAHGERVAGTQELAAPPKPRAPSYWAVAEFSWDGWVGAGGAASVPRGMGMRTRAS